MIVYGFMGLSLRRLKASKMIFGLSIAAFAMGTAHWASRVSYDQIQMQEIIRFNQALDLEAELHVMERRLFRPDIVAFWSSTLAVRASEYVLPIPVTKVYGT